MKRATQRLLLAAALITVLNFQSCKKYEDGPAFTLKTKKSRLSGEWEVVRVYDNSGVQVFPYSGSDYSVEIEFEFEKDGDFEQSYFVSYDGYSYSSSAKGEWEFSSDKEELEVEIDNFKQDWEITRLTSKEFNFEDEDGYEWELEAK
ncbi:hypothetical protein [Crocinitomix algicola]|uniref:hypothetical protein n=1 Tax=Crocinitomix algicola TaxID=1740263 RepID=UPI000835E470|nr:hypothetical protein [Crocinitomix algicola]